MNELYWITRLNGINTVITIFLVLSSIALVFTTIGYIVNRCEEIEYPHREETPKYKRIFFDYFKYSITVFVICILGKIFIPTTTEALLIYGVGGTIDYIKENPTAKKLPDKCINALDKWVDTLSKEKKETKESNE